MRERVISSFRRLIVDKDIQVLTPKMHFTVHHSVHLSIVAKTDTQNKTKFRIVIAVNDRSMAKQYKLNN